MAKRSAAEKFDKFLKDNGISIRKAGEALRVTDPTILDWRHARKVPSPEHRVAIRVWTNGAVAESEWKTERERVQAKAASTVEPFVPQPEGSARKRKAS